MIVDSSIFVAIAHQEKDSGKYVTTLLEAADVAVSTATLLETYLVLSHQHPQSWLEIEGIVSDMNITLIPFDATILEFAKDAHKRYGKGQGSKAKLNYGDCFSYATAKALDKPLLFVGNDFKHTDIQSVL